MNDESWRYIAQRVPGGEFVDFDLPLSDVTITRTLSGPGRLSATIPVEVTRLRGPDGRPVLDPWGTAIWAERGGQIRGGGIYVAPSLRGQAWSLDCMGISGYPQAMAWTGDPYSGVDVDPLDLVRRIWDHLQSQPGGNLGVSLDPTVSPVRVGTAEDAPATDTGAATGPVRLDWWSTHDLGKVIDDHAASTPFDYLEDTLWEGEQLVHRLRLGYPTLGTRRADLRFAIGENIALIPDLSAAEGDYATEVLGLGAGEGRTTVRTPTLTRPAPGLRRVVVHTDKSARTTEALLPAARAALAAADGALGLRQVVVNDHPHAPLGSFDVGDEIPITGPTGWVDLDAWVRVVEIEIKPTESDRMTVTVVEV